VQKFTREITREIELGGERLALTFTAEGITVRPVGGRSAFRKASWAKVFGLLMGSDKDPTPQEVAAAVAAFKKPPRRKKGDKASPPAEAAKEQPSQPAGQSGELQPLLQRLEHWLAKHRPNFLKGLRPGANEVELHQLGAQLGLTVPDDLRTLLAWHNGQAEGFAGCFEENWLLMSADRILAAKHELDAGAAGNGAGNGWKPEWIPFLEDDSGDCLCLDTTQAGAPVRAFWLQSEEAAAVVSPSLAAWVADFVTAVEAGKYHEEPERGTFLRSQS
jgi:cell wall assembly regulator SMI1